ncbi:L,D-transpeptidase family protein [Hyphomicrobium sp.]|uniref:L,D-transpeptidase family protein n=1 Tax=Hyphomicrobium sp. TaxID=82 RepID=UPI003F7302A5
MIRWLKSIVFVAGCAGALLAIVGPAAAQERYDRYDRYNRYDRYDRYDRDNRRSRDRAPVSRPPAESSKEDSAETTAQPPIGPAVLAVVSLRHQRVSVYDAQGRAVRAGVSSGQSDYETPVGIYAILQKNRDHYSNLYDDASMPFMQRLTWSGIALHAGALPGHPASHGCVRLPHSYAEQIFDQSKIGMRVIVARDDRVPVEISHPLLFKPSIKAGAGVAQVPTPIAYDPAEAGKTSPFEADLTAWPERRAQLEALRPEAKAKAAEAESAKAQADELNKIEKAKTAEVKKLAKPLARAERNKKRAGEAVVSAAKRLAAAKTDSQRKSAETRSAAAAKDVIEADAALATIKAKHEAAAAEAAKATAASAAGETAKAAAVAAAVEARGKMLPVSVFVSLKTQRAYVRQGHEPVFDMPVTISHPETPIGTHVFTAVDYTDGGNGVRWMATALPARADDDTGDYDRGSKRSASKTEAPPPTDVAAASAALDRITFPPEFVARVSGYVWPRSSLIVSDEDISKETGNATDFVVLISGEPQGGIKKRPKQPPPDYYAYDSYYYDDGYYYDRKQRRRQKYNSFFSFW